MSAAAPGRSRPRWSGGASPRPGDASATSCANGACGRVRAQTVRTAQDAGRRGRAREHPRPRVRRLRAATRLAGGLTYVRVGGEWAYVCLLAGLANRGITGHNAGTGRTADLVMAAFAMLGFPLTGAAGSTTRESTGCSTCSTSEDRRQGRATRTTTPWSNPPTGS